MYPIAEYPRDNTIGTIEIESYRLGPFADWRPETPHQYDQLHSWKGKWGAFVYEPWVTHTRRGCAGPAQKKTKFNVWDDPGKFMDFY